MTWCRINRRCLEKWKRREEEKEGKKKDGRKRRTGKKRLGGGGGVRGLAELSITASTEKEQVYRVQNNRRNKRELYVNNEPG